MMPLREGAMRLILLSVLAALDGAAAACSSVSSTRGRDGGSTAGEGDSSTGCGSLPKFTARALVAGEHFHTCAVIADGTVHCWGNSTITQLYASDETIPTVFPGIAGASAIVSPGGHSCVLLSDGTVRCWGSNEHGELGNGRITSTILDTAVLVEVVGISTAVAISAAACEDIPEIPVRNSGIRRIIRVFCKLTRAG